MIFNDLRQKPVEQKTISEFSKNSGTVIRFSMGDQFAVKVRQIGGYSMENYSGTKKVMKTMVFGLISGKMTPKSFKIMKCYNLSKDFGVNHCHFQGK